jgi:hypothetical protein
MEPKVGAKMSRFSSAFAPKIEAMLAFRSALGFMEKPNVPPLATKILIVPTTF